MALASRPTLQQSNMLVYLRCSKGPIRPGGRCPLRSQHLDSRQQVLHNTDLALFADGGANEEATAAARQARAFAGSHYWTTASEVGPQLAVRLPARYGWEHTTVHTAELLAILRWRRPGEWNLLVLDRASLFPLLRLDARSQARILSSPCHHLVSRVRTVSRELSAAWQDDAPAPLRVHQLTAPETWHVQGTLQGALQHSVSGFWPGWCPCSQSSDQYLCPGAGDRGRQ